MATKQNWSKFGSSTSLETRNKLKKLVPSLPFEVFGKAKDLKIDNSKLYIQISFFQNHLKNNLDSFWFPLDIEQELFVLNYSSIESFKERIKQEDVIISLSYKPPNIQNGLAKIISDLFKKYDNNHYNKIGSISGFINGINQDKGVISKTLKPLSNKEVNTALTITENSVSISASEKSFIQIEKTGLTLSAESINLQTLPQNIKFAGIFQMQNIFLGLMPSTSFFPVPQYTLNLPVEMINNLTPLTKIAKSFIGT